MGRLRVEVREVGRVNPSLQETYWSQALQMPPLRPMFLPFRSPSTPHEETQLMITLSHPKCQKDNTYHHCQKENIFETYQLKRLEQVWLIHSQYQMGPVRFSSIFHFSLSHLLCYLLTLLLFTSG